MYYYTIILFLYFTTRQPYFQFKGIYASYHLEDDHLLLDQRQLPHKERWLKMRTCSDVANAIADMVVRDFLHRYLHLRSCFGNKTRRQKNAEQKLLDSRPTAVNLQWP